MNITRRHLLAGTALLPVGAVLAGCTAPQLAQFQTDTNLINAGLQGILPILQKGGIAVPAALSGYLSALASAAQAVLGAATASAAQSPVSQVAAAVNAIVGVLAGLSLVSPPVTALLLAAQVLLPIIETAVGIKVVGAPAGAMSPDAARLILAGH